MRGVTSLGEIDDLPQPQEKPEGCVMQLWVHLAAFQSRVLAVFDGGAELPVLSNRIYQQMYPQPELRPATENLRGLYGPAHQPIGQCTVRMEIPELCVRVSYDVVVDDIAEDMLVDASLMSYMGISVRYADKMLERKGKTTRGIARLKGESRVRWLMIAKDWVIQPRSRQLVPGKAVGGETPATSQWMVEPCRSLKEKTGMLVGQTLCHGAQLDSIVPVEVYNPWDEPVHLYKNTTLGLLNPLQTVTGVQFQTKDQPTKIVRSTKWQSASVEPLPEELQALVDEAGQEVTPGVRDDFAALLHDIKELFVLKGQKLGHTNVV